MKTKSYVVLFICSFIVMGLASASDYGFENPTIPHLNPEVTTTTSANYSTINVNNSLYWNGYAFSHLADTYVPYLGANKDVDLGTHWLNTTGDINALHFRASAPSGYFSIGGYGAEKSTWYYNFASEYVSLEAYPTIDLILQSSNIPGVGALTGDGGKVILRGGSTVDGNGGQISVSGGEADTTSGTGGDLVMSAGGGFQGGDVDISSGQGEVGSANGNVVFRTGSGVGSDGRIEFYITGDLTSKINKTGLYEFNSRVCTKLNGMCAETDPFWSAWVDVGGVCTEGDKCGYFSTCSQITNPEGCGALTSESDPKAYNGTLAYNSSLSNYYLNSNPNNYVNVTSIENTTIVRNNTSPTFKNVTATSGIFSTIYSSTNLLSIDVTNRLLYDLATKLSIDYNDRKLYASDGSSYVLDWNAVGLAEFGDNNITTTGTTTTNILNATGNIYGGGVVELPESWCIGHGCV